MANRISGIYGGGSSQWPNRKEEARYAIQGFGRDGAKVEGKRMETIIERAQAAAHHLLSRASIESVTITDRQSNEIVETLSPSAA